MQPFDINVDGKGMWKTIHLLAVHSTTEQLKQSFASIIDVLFKNFPCEVCKPDINKFMNNHPLKQYWNTKNKTEDFGMFKWTWELHNVVNQKLGKTVVSFDDAYNLYKHNVCKNCGTNVIGISKPILIPINDVNFNNEPKFNLISYY